MSVFVLEPECAGSDVEQANGALQTRLHMQTWPLLQWSEDLVLISSH
jgi:hypothetical protein